MDLRLVYYKVRLELSDDERAQSGEVGIQNGKDGTEYSFIMAHESRVDPRIVHQKSGATSPPQDSTPLSFDRALAATVMSKR